MKNYSCEEIVELIPQYVNGELQDDQAEEIHEHIKSCEKCSTEYRFWLNLKNDILESEFVPEADIKSNIMRVVLKEKRSRVLKNALVKFVAAAACILIICGVGPAIINNFLTNNNQIHQKPSLPSLSEFSEYIYLTSEEFSSDESFVLSESNLSEFLGTWSGNIGKDKKIFVEILEDGSVVTCIEDKWGLKVYYDGELTFNEGGTVTLSQSDGNISSKAKVSIFIDKGRICVGLISGNMPWSMQKYS